MSNIKTQLMTKISIIIVLFVLICAFANIKPQIYRTENNTISSDTIPEVKVSSTKKERYLIYLNNCNEIVKDTILQTGYLNFDTMRVASIPVNNLYLGKTIIKSVQISKELANLIVMDTVWNELAAPEYRSSYDYYVLAKHAIPTYKKVDFDYSDKIIVFRLREYSLKKNKPLVFSDWDRYINNKSTRTSTTEQYF